MKTIDGLIEFVKQMQNSCLQELDNLRKKQKNGDFLGAGYSIMQKEHDLTEVIYMYTLMLETIEKYKTESGNHDQK